MTLKAVAATSMMALLCMFACDAGEMGSTVVAADVDNNVGEDIASSTVSTQPINADSTGAAVAPVTSAESVVQQYRLPIVPETPSMPLLIGRIVGALFLVSGLIVLGVFLMKKFFNGARLPGGAKRQIRMIEATSLGGKRHIYLVRAMDRLLVIGASGEQIQLLSEIKDSVLLKEVEAEIEPERFKNILQNMLPSKLAAAAAK